MWQRIRGHALSAWPAYGFVGLLAAVSLAWKSGWLPVHRSAAATRPRQSVADLPAKDRSLDRAPHHAVEGAESAEQQPANRTTNRVETQPGLLSAGNPSFAAGDAPLPGDSISATESGAEPTIRIVSTNRPLSVDTTFAAELRRELHQRQTAGLPEGRAETIAEGRTETIAIDQSRFVDTDRNTRQDSVFSEQPAASGRGEQLAAGRHAPLPPDTETAREPTPPSLRRSTQEPPGAPPFATASRTDSATESTNRTAGDRPDVETRLPNSSADPDQPPSPASNPGVKGSDPPPRVARIPNTPETGPRPRSPEAVPAAPAVTADNELAEIDRLIAAGDDIAALRQLSQIYWNSPRRRGEIQTRLNAVAGRMFFSPQPHYLPPYVVKPGDRLEKIAARYNVSWEYLAKLNRVEPKRIRVDQKLKVIKGPFSAFVQLSNFELTVHLHGYYVKRYPIGIGKDNASPTGRFQVKQKVRNPQYTTPEGKVIDADDPNNPVGDYWIDIGDGFGIHGTIDPDSIGRAESRGCIRLRNNDIAEVFDLLTVGSEVIIRP